MVRVPKEGETYSLKHDRAYLVSMVLNQKDRDGTPLAGSVYRINYKLQQEMDGKNVVFGMVIGDRSKTYGPSKPWEPFKDGRSV